MVKYNFRFPGFTQAALIAAAGCLIAGANISGIIFPGINRSSLITEIDWQGFGITSATAEFGIYRTITAAAAGALTTVIVGKPTIFVGTQPVFSGSAGQGTFATTQPTLDTNPTHSFDLNQNGQRYFWRANPNLDNAIDMPGTATALLNGLIIVQIGGAGVIPSAGRIQVSEI